MNGPRITLKHFLKACALFREQSGITPGFSTSGELFGMGWDFDEGEAAEMAADLVANLNMVLGDASLGGNDETECGLVPDRPEMP